MQQKTHGTLLPLFATAGGFCRTRDYRASVQPKNPSLVLLSFPSVDVHASVHERPDEDVGEEVLEDECGDQLLLVEEVHGLRARLLQQVVHSEDARNDEVEKEAVQRSQALERRKKEDMRWGE